MPFPRFKTIDALYEHYKLCPICDSKVINSQKYYSCYGQCGDHYFYSARSNYLKGNKESFSLINESFVFDNFLIIFGDEWYMKKTITVNLFLFKDKSKSNLFQMVHSRYLLNNQDTVIWSKKFTYSKFIKNFKFNDKKEFNKKIQSLKKSLVLI